MERISTIENFGEWRNLKSEAPKKAIELMDQIENYEALSRAEKIVALHSLLVELSQDQKNRFVVEILATQLSVLNEEERHYSRMSELKANIAA